MNSSIIALRNSSSGYTTRQLFQGRFDASNGCVAYARGRLYLNCATIWLDVYTLGPDGNVMGTNLQTNFGSAGKRCKMIVIDDRLYALIGNGDEYSAYEYSLSTGKIGGVAC